jgi:cyd operon protein YbgT
MWYFAWILGVGFAVLLAIMNAMWGETQEARAGATDDRLERDPRS